jgi:hypothetical protein
MPSPSGIELILVGISKVTIRLMENQTTLMKAFIWSNVYVQKDRLNTQSGRNLLEIDCLLIKLIIA